MANNDITREQMMVLLESKDDCFNQIAEIIGNDSDIFHSVLHYAVYNNRFDLYQKLLDLDFQIKFTILTNILSADPPYFDYYLSSKGYCHEDISKSLNYRLGDLTGPWAPENFDRIKNIIHNMKKINLESRNISNLIEIDHYLIKSNHSIKSEIIAFLDQYRFEFDSDFAFVLASSRSSLVRTILSTYYDFDYNIFLGAVMEYNLEVIKYLIENYPIMEIDLSVIVKAPYEFCYLEDFEKCYLVLKLLEDYSIRIVYTKLDETFMAFIKLAEYLKKY